MLNESELYFENFASQWVMDAYARSKLKPSIGEQRMQHVLDIVSKTSNASLNILDIGSGGGQIAKALLAQGHKVTAVDRSLQMLTLLQNECQDLPLSQQQNLTTIQSCATTLHKKIETFQFDAILCIGMIYYLEDENVIYKLIKKHLIPNGIAVITFRNKLFNLFPNSKHPVSEADELNMLYKQTRALNKDIEISAFQQYLLAMKEKIDESLAFLDGALEAGNETFDTPCLKNELDIKNILGRQHTPEQVAKIVSEFKLKPTKFYGIQPHFMLARHDNNLINQCLQSLSTPLWQLSNTSLALSWSSHFLVELNHL